MDAVKYIGFFFGDKEKAIENLERWIPLYKNSPNNHSEKVLKRIEDYERLLTEIKDLL